jgi:hypothetical protein
MQYALWILLSIIAYASGLLVIMKVTPRLLSRSFDEVIFMGIASLDILGALLAFGAVVITYALFNGALAIKFLTFFLAIGIFIVSIRTALHCFRGAAVGTFRVSRIIAGSYGLFLAAAAVFYIVQLFL